MHQNPTVVEALVRDRIAELRRSASSMRRAKRRHRIQAARTRAGWLLVDLGLRLAVTRAAIRHPVARG